MGRKVTIISAVNKNVWQKLAKKAAKDRKVVHDAASRAYIMSLSKEKPSPSTAQSPPSASVGSTFASRGESKVTIASILKKANGGDSA